MTDYEKLSRLRRDLEDIRSDLCRRIASSTSANSDLADLHERVSRAIKALYGQG